ncbi:MAG: GIY-YIG nuclease family protein, partial [Candidatus Kapaibacterium sp.]
MYSIYILHSDALDRYYIGQTNDISRRMLEHNQLSTDTYTSKFRPWTVALCVEISPRRSDAVRVELY